ncbi:hypothetical protein R7R52_23425 [Vibrio sp. 665]|uniref:hypothetical protein n=1 Tax=Gammaproteobacteria TaxID=1236 RepID=UPI0029641FBF|nr:hypothetical protein [Vibrio sp. 665]MDW2034955.1 hypothetical protein [Vibrio sp. 665]
MTPDDEPGWRRLTQAEIEDLRAEMRAAGKWMKEEMAKRRREHRLEEARRVAQEMWATARYEQPLTDETDKWVWAIQDQEDEDGHVISRRPVWHRKDLFEEWQRLRLGK